MFLPEILQGRHGESLPTESLIEQMAPLLLSEAGLLAEELRRQEILKLNRGWFELLPITVFDEHHGNEPHIDLPLRIRIASEGMLTVMAHLRRLQTECFCDGLVGHVVRR